MDTALPFVTVQTDSLLSSQTAHFAYSVMFSVTVSVPKFHAAPVPAAFLYQPSKVQPVRCGARYLAFVQNLRMRGSRAGRSVQAERNGVGVPRPSGVERHGFLKATLIKSWGHTETGRGNRGFLTKLAVFLLKPPV
jgi:hypothetical protein